VSPQVSFKLNLNSVLFRLVFLKTVGVFEWFHWPFLSMKANWDFRETLVEYLLWRVKRGRKKKNEISLSCQIFPPPFPGLLQCRDSFFFSFVSEQQDFPFRRRQRQNHLFNTLNKDVCSETRFYVNIHRGFGVVA